MGLYLNDLGNGTFLPNVGKAQALVNAGATQISRPRSEADFRENMVCVVVNERFDAAAYADTPEEMMRFATPRRDDSRPQFWFIYDGAKEVAR